MSTFTRRVLLKCSALVSAAIVGNTGVSRHVYASTKGSVSIDGPDPVFEKPGPLSMADLLQRPLSAVSASEVNDYAPGHYSGALNPNTPHADINPKKAVITLWKNSPCRFVFSHEASYCPILELPNGAGMGNQFFEGNMGEAEVFNAMGRKERNSFVDIVQSGPEHVWVRWTYFAVNKDDDTQPRLRATEDYFADPNGLVLRRTTYESLIPNDIFGYSTQPVELYGVLPQGARLNDHFSRDSNHGDYHVMSAFDLYGDQRYDIFWDEKGGVRRNADDAALIAITRSPGAALVIPYKDQLLFAALGTASGFSPKYNQFVDHSTPGAAGGVGWGQGRWDHWPVGWLNAQIHHWKEDSPYPSHFGSIGQFFLPEGKRLKTFMKDYSEGVKDMSFNRWTEQRVFYVLLGSASSWNEIREIGRKWLDKGKDCARRESISDIR